MINNENNKITELTSVINRSILSIDESYRKGASLRLYKEVLSCRKSSKKVVDFLRNDSNLELMHRTLIEWDMNSRGAKIEDLEPFKHNIVDNINSFQEIENAGEYIQNISNIDNLCKRLKTIYNNLKIMKSDAKLVSNSKLLHFVFPNLLLPIDRKYSLTYFYGNTGDSLNKYLEIIRFSHRLAKQDINWANYIDKQNWNTGIPKIIDNAIILKNKLGV